MGVILAKGLQDVEWDAFLGTLEKLRKANVRFVMSVRLPVCPHETTRVPLDGFS